jgi:hypothetical protein
MPGKVEECEPWNLFGVEQRFKARLVDGNHRMFCINEINADKKRKKITKVRIGRLGLVYFVSCPGG